MDKRFVLFLFLAVLVFAVLASNVWPKELAVGQSVSVSLSEADMAVLRAYAADQLEGSEAPATDAEITAEALRLAQAFAARAIDDVVRAQSRRFVVEPSDAVIIDAAEAVVSRKIAEREVREAGRDDAE